MFKSLKSKHAQQSLGTNGGLVATTSSTAGTASDRPVPFLKLSAHVDVLGPKISSSSSTNSASSTRVPSSDGGDREPPIRASKAPKVPVLSANGKKLVEKLLNQCKITSEFPLVELLSNTSAMDKSEVKLELNAVDKLQLAIEAAAFSRDDALGFDHCCDVPEERMPSSRLRSCLKTTDVSHPGSHPRPAQLRKRVCFRSGLDGDPTPLGSDVTELHLYELVRLKHRYTPGEESSCLTDKASPRSERYGSIGMMPLAF